MSSKSTNIETNKFSCPGQLVTKPPPLYAAHQVFCTFYPLFALWFNALIHENNPHHENYVLFIHTYLHVSNTFSFSLPAYIYLGISVATDKSRLLRNAWTLFGLRTRQVPTAAVKTEKFHYILDTENLWPKFLQRTLNLPSPFLSSSSLLFFFCPSSSPE